MVKATDTTHSSSNASIGPGPSSQTALSRAWISIALVPVFLFAAFAASEGIYTLTGYDPSTGTVPLWADLAAGLPSLALLLIPCIAGVVYGRRAARSGVRAGLVAAVIAGLLGLGSVLLVVLNVALG